MNYLLAGFAKIVNVYAEEEYYPGIKNSGAHYPAIKYLDFKIFKSGERWMNSSRWKKKTYNRLDWLQQQRRKCRIVTLLLGLHTGSNFCAVFANLSPFCQIIIFVRIQFATYTKYINTLYAIKRKEVLFCFPQGIVGDAALSNLYCPSMNHF
jgi:hypothetical protein